MRRSLFVPLLVLLAAACSSQSSASNEPSPTPQSRSSPQLEAQLLEVHDSAEPAPGQALERFDESAPPDDERRVAVQLRVTNTGDAEFVGEISAFLRTDARTYAPSFHHVAECEEFARVRIEPGATRTGCRVYDLHQEEQLQTLRLVPLDEQASPGHVWPLGSPSVGS